METRVEEMVVCVHGTQGTWRSERWHAGNMALSGMAHRGHGARRDGTQGTWRSETWRAGDMALDYHVPRNLPQNIDRF